VSKYLIKLSNYRLCGPISKKFADFLPNRNVVSKKTQPHCVVLQWTGAESRISIGVEYKITGIIQALYICNSQSIFFFYPKMFQGIFQKTDLHF
jgi:hypothetical protein